MTKAELMNLVGKWVLIHFKNDEWIYGKLGYADTFSAKHDWRSPDYFYIGNVSFKVSHVRKVKESVPEREKETEEEKHTCSNCQHRNPVDDNKYRCFMRASLVTRLGSDTCRLWE